MTDRTIASPSASTASIDEPLSHARAGYSVEVRLDDGPNDD